VSRVLEGQQVVLPKGYRPTNPAEILPWEHAAERLERAENYWLATTRKDGRPHVAPVWGVWVQDRLFFDGIPTAQWAKNMASNPNAAIHLESGTDVVIVEGVLEDIPGIDHPELAGQIVESWTAKYGRLMPDPEKNGMYCLNPRAARAWTRFPDDVTRWSFAAT
jgi:hypothetical protein